jgi:hypothetical protein
MALAAREAVARQSQGVDEEIVYSITTTAWGTGPSSVSFKVYDDSADFADVTSTVCPGSASVVGDVITLPKLKALTPNHIYRVEVKFTAGGNVWEPYFTVLAER